MMNVFPPDHVDDLPDPALAILEPALVDENEEPEEEEEFEDEEELEEEEPQEEEKDMEVDIEEEENEPELIYSYDMVGPEDETVPNSVHEVGESSTATFLREDGDSLLPVFMRRDINSLFGRIASLTRRVCGHETVHALVEKKGKAKDKYYGKLILDLGNEVRSSMDEGATALENLVRKFGNAEERAEYKKLRKELEDAMLSNTLLSMQKERVKKDLYWTEFKLMVPSGDDSIMLPKSRPLTQAAIERMITQRVNEALTTDRASECAKGKKVKFTAAILQGPALTWWNTKVATMGLEVVNQIP
ncbi:hypothetical protein Tco_0784972 [Tanacetum coccineum]